MSMGHGMGSAWRHMRTDRSIVGQKLPKDTVRRVFGFAKPHRGLIAVFLSLTVVDAALVVVTPLLVRQIVDNGILKHDTKVLAFTVLKSIRAQAKGLAADTINLVLAKNPFMAPIFPSPP